VELNKLTANQVARAQPGRYGDGGGLALIVSTSPDGSLNKKFIFRFTWNGKPTECGMGGYGTTLAEARAKAVEARRMVRAGINPVEAKRAAKRRVATPTFGKCALELIAAKVKGEAWRSKVHARQWRETLETHAKSLWNLPVDQIDTAAVFAVLQPLWHGTPERKAIPETAARLRGRIEAVLDAARTDGFIGANEANPARWKGHLDKKLTGRKPLSRGHHAAMAYDRVPGYMAELSQSETIQSLALQYLILTAARSGEVLGARWAEIDLDAKVWTVPATRMKSGREHRVPLSARAVEILEKLAETRWNDLVFPGRHGQLSRSAVAELVPAGATMHGFRSSFRDWAGEETSFPRDVAEGALAHSTGDATERAYRRGDALEKRRALMEAWAQFCGQRDNVLSLFRA
jgi:integrase